MVRKIKKREIIARYSIIIFILLYGFNYSFAQNENLKEDLFNKNAIYGDFGYFAVWGSVTGFYERILTQNALDGVSTFAKIGYGYAAGSSSGGEYVFVQYGVITGMNNYHLEFGAGPMYLNNGLSFSGFAGWRFQKPKSNSLFRMGFGWPESLYFGTGFSF